MRRSALPLLVVLASGLVTTNSSARTFLVDPGPTTIQAAIAQAVEPDTVLLNPGRYVLGEDIIVIRRAITLKSVAGPASTIIVNGSQIGPDIWITSMVGGPTIQGLTIEQGGNFFTGVGGGIYSEGASPTIVDNLVLWNGAGNIEGEEGWGGGIGIIGGSPTVQRNTIVANLAASGGLYLEGGSGTVDHNVIAYNYSSTHTGPDSSRGFGYSCNASSASVHDNIFWANLPAQVDPFCGRLLGVDGNIELDPRFCGPLQFGEFEGGWSVRASSPVAPGQPYFGWGAPTGVCAATEVQPTTWGSLKARYR